MTESFDDIADVLLGLGTVISPSALHGQLVGQVCLGAVPGGAAWLAQVADMGGTKIEISSRYGDRLVEWLHEVVADLADEDFVFELLLPSDDEALVERMEELATWCRSYSEGVAIAAASIAGGADFSEDTRDLFGDIVEISQLDPDSAEDDSQEVDFDELVEYVRVGVIQLSLETLEASTPVEPEPDPDEIYH